MTCGFSVMKKVSSRLMNPLYCTGQKVIKVTRITPAARRTEIIGCFPDGFIAVFLSCHFPERIVIEAKILGGSPRNCQSRPERREIGDATHISRSFGGFLGVAGLVWVNGPARESAACGRTTQCTLWSAVPRHRFVQQASARGGRAAEVARRKAASSRRTPNQDCRSGIGFASVP